MLVTTTCVITGIGATVGFCAGAAYAKKNLVGKEDSLIKKIAKIAGCALLGALVVGAGTLGACVTFQTYGAFRVLLVALIVLGGFAEAFG